MKRWEGVRRFQLQKRLPSQGRLQGSADEDLRGNRRAIEVVIQKRISEDPAFAIRHAEIKSAAQAARLANEVAKKKARDKSDAAIKQKRAAKKAKAEKKRKLRLGLLDTDHLRRLARWKASKKRKKSI